MALVFALHLGCSGRKEIDVERIVYGSVWTSSVTSSMRPEDRWHIIGVR